MIYLKGRDDIVFYVYVCILCLFSIISEITIIWIKSCNNTEMIQMQSSVKRDFIEINFRYIKTTWKNIREGGVELIDGKLLIYSKFE